MVLTFWTAFAIGPMAFAQILPSISAEVSHTGDTSHFELTGRDNWNYELHREVQGKNDVIVMRVPAIEARSLLGLKTWSSPLIQSVHVNEHAADGQMEITFVLKDKTVQSFDYQTDQPSRLIIDFFQQLDENGKSIAAKKPLPLPKKKTASISKKIRIEKHGIWMPERKPASSELLHDEINTTQNTVPVSGENLARGIFDGGDPDFLRFKVKDYEINENAIIASQQNIYLRFPQLRLDQKHFQAILNAPPIYEIVPDNTDENKEARLLYTLFQEKHDAVFLKTYQYFIKKYPNSRYEEIVKYMYADIYYHRWQDTEDKDDFEEAIKTYRGLVQKFPDSPLAERTQMVVGYSLLGRGDYVNSLQTFDDFVRTRAQSSHADSAKIAIAESYLGLNKYEDAKKVLEDLEAHASQTKHSVEASFRMGDIAFQKQDYASAVQIYRDAMKAHPDDWAEYPNAYFNTAESLFWLGQYRESLDAYRDYLRRFPTHPHGGYAMTRLGELMEILGVDQKRVMGAYLECYFRYNSTPGAKVARVRLLSQRMRNMKPKELDDAIAESTTIAKETNLPEMPEFVTIMVTDGLYKRKEFDNAIQRLIQFYQQNPSSKSLALMQKRIVRDITEQIKTEIDDGKFLDGLRTYGRYSESWLRNNDRIDIRYYLGKAYEQAGVFKEAAKLYRETINQIYSLAGTKEGKEKNVLESLPTADLLNLRLAEVSLHQGDFAKSIDYLRDIKSIESFSDADKVERVEIAAAIAEKTGRTAEAVNYLDQLIQSWKGQPHLVANPLLKLAQMSVQNRDYVKAEISLQKIIGLQNDTQLVPKDIYAQALELQGDTFLKENKKDEAVKAYSSLLDKFEKDRPLSSIRYRLGEIEYKRGNVKQAQADWQPLADSPNKVWYQLAQEQMNNDQFHDDYKKYLNRLPATAEGKGTRNEKP